MADENRFLEELQKELNKYMEEVNSTPREEMDNLSPNDMQFILYNTFAKGSPIQYRSQIKNELLAQIPFFKLFREYLSKIKEAGELKLTAKGNLPRKTCLELYEAGIIKEDYIERGIVKLNKEADSVVIQNLKIIGKLSGVTKARNNKMSLTKQGEKLFSAESQSELFKKVFETNLLKFNLGFHDGYPQDAPIQFLMGYTIYLLLRYGKEERDIDFYINKNLIAFPQVLEHFQDSWSTPERQYSRCYTLRAFERFLDYYGFVKMNRTRIPEAFDDKIDLTTTSQFRAIFEIRPENFKFKKAGFRA